MEELREHERGWSERGWGRVKYVERRDVFGMKGDVVVMQVGANFRGILLLRVYRCGVWNLGAGDVGY